ncbi:MAG: exosome complex protein Rrp4 [Desulfurococcales archaeon]|nr:exosome complex protein Rrp4 [Desulfurococcales archaeon]
MARQERRIVVPGDRLPPETTGPEEYLVDNGGWKTPAIVGILDVRDGKHVFIPLQGAYVPRKGDVVIGLIVSQGIVNWFVDINSPYQAILTAQDFLGRPFNPLTDDLSRLLRIGDYIKARVEAFDRTRNPLLTVQGEDLGRIVEGRVIDVHPSRIPRIIGKKHSMINMISEETGCKLYAAVNGRIHIVCPNPDSEAIAIMAIKKIEKEPHTVGLTERVKRLIEEEKKVRGV